MGNVARRNLSGLVSVLVHFYKREEKAQKITNLYWYL